MNDSYIVTAYSVIDDVLKTPGYSDDRRATIGAAEILTVAVVAAKYFQNHHERALCILIKVGDIAPLSLSRFNRRLHALSEWLYRMVTLLGELFATGDVFIIDSMPLPVCKRVRARRCKKVRGKVYCGYCAAKHEKFFGWRLHLVCTADGVPVAFDLLPASLQDLTPLHELTVSLPTGATVFGDKGYIAAPDAQTFLKHAGCAWFRPGVPTCNRIAGLTILTSACIANGLRRFTRNWKKWAFNPFMLGPILVLI